MKRTALVISLAALLCACQDNTSRPGNESAPAPTPVVKKEPSTPTMPTKPKRAAPKIDPRVGLTPEQLKKYNETASFYSDIILGEEADLLAGTTHKIAGTDDVIEFVRITKETRCPTGVQCVWAGEVGVEIKATTAGKTQTLTLDEKPTSWNGYQLVMKDVLPHPSQTPSTKLPSLRLLVVKAGQAVEVSAIPGTTPTVEAPAQVKPTKIEQPTKPLTKLPVPRIPAPGIPAPTELPHPSTLDKNALNNKEDQAVKGTEKSTPVSSTSSQLNKTK